MGRVVADMDMQIWPSAFSSFRAIVDFPAPEGEERTNRRPRRAGGSVNAMAATDSTPWERSRGAYSCLGFSALSAVVVFFPSAARRASTLCCSFMSCCARSEEHTSELQSLMRSSYAVFCLKKKMEKEQ